MTRQKYLALPLRRSLTQPWFKPIARIGSRGNDEYVLEPARPVGKDVLARETRRRNHRADPAVACSSTSTTRWDRPVGSISSTISGARTPAQPPSRSSGSRTPRRPDSTQGCRGKMIWCAAAVTLLRPPLRRRAVLHRHALVLEQALQFARLTRPPQSARALCRAAPSAGGASPAWPRTLLRYPAKNTHS